MAFSSLHGNGCLFAVFDAASEQLLYPRFVARRLISLYAMTAAIFLSVSTSPAQTKTEAPSPDERIALSKLFPAVYPPLARQARIIGTVEILVHVQPDGSVESAEVISGHPILRQAALDSARQSLFECERCREPVTSYTLHYKFEIADHDPLKDCETAPEPPPPPAEIDVLKQQVTVFTWPLWICDPSGEIIRVRSAKCLYLWKCGIRYPL